MGGAVTFVELVSNATTSLGQKKSLRCLWYWITNTARSLTRFFRRAKVLPSLVQAPMDWIHPGYPASDPVFPVGFPPLPGHMAYMSTYVGSEHRPDIEDPEQRPEIEEPERETELEAKPEFDFPWFDMSMVD